MATRRRKKTGSSEMQASEPSMPAEGSPGLDLLGFGSTIGELIRGGRPRKQTAKRRTKKKRKTTAKAKTRATGRAGKRTVGRPAKRASAKRASAKRAVGRPAKKAKRTKRGRRSSSR